MEINDGPMMRRVVATTAGEELAGAELGDRRRVERLRLIAEQLEAEPAKSFPRAMGSDAALEAFYRFINNQGFSAADIVAPHVQATLARASNVGAVVAVHDTTYVEYRGERADLGPTTNKNHYGFIAHAALLIAEADGMPLGLGHLETLMRTGKKWAVRKRQGQRGRVQKGDDQRESVRWLRGVEAVESARQQNFDVVHVTDAEGDFYELLAWFRTRSGRVVIRAGQLERVVTLDGQQQSLRAVADAIVPRTWRRVELSERRHKPRACVSTRLRHPNRSGRVARLAIGQARIVVGKSRYSNIEAEPFEVNVVRVWEARPPAGEPQTEWILLTNEAATADAQLERIVDLYRKRWAIEEYFKALKSGCSLEKRQIESYEALCKVLALFVPIAYRLLLLRSLERKDSNEKATRAFSPIDLELLARAPSNCKHPPPRTVADALSHLARLGGHIRNNGRPGWQTLSWGYEKLLLIKLGWEMAMSGQAREM
jgi:hypothetical protein